MSMDNFKPLTNLFEAIQCLNGTVDQYGVIVLTLS